MEFRSVGNVLNYFLCNVWIGCIVAVTQANFDSCSVVNEVVKRSVGQGRTVYLLVQDPGHYIRIRVYIREIWRACGANNIYVACLRRQYLLH